MFPIHYGDSHSHTAHVNPAYNLPSPGPLHHSTSQPSPAVHHGHAHHFSLFHHHHHEAAASIPETPVSRYPAPPRVNDVLLASFAALHLALSPHPPSPSSLAVSLASAEGVPQAAPGVGLPSADVAAARLPPPPLPSHPPAAREHHHRLHALRHHHIPSLSSVLLGRPFHHLDVPSPAGSAGSVDSSDPHETAYEDWRINEDKVTEGERDHDRDDAGDGVEDELQPGLKPAKDWSFEKKEADPARLDVPPKPAPPAPLLPPRPPPRPHYSATRGLSPRPAPSPPPTPSPPPSPRVPVVRSQSVTASLSTVPALTSAEYVFPPLPSVALWETLDFVPIVMRQGSSVPPVVIETVQPPHEGTGITPPRPYLRLLLPFSPSSTDALHSLCCRQKRHAAVWRFSIDPERLTRAHNPFYAGSLIRLDGDGRADSSISAYDLRDADDALAGHIVVSRRTKPTHPSQPTPAGGAGWKVWAELLGHHSPNDVEQGRGGRMLVGGEDDATALLQMRVEASDRSVLVREEVSDAGSQGRKVLTMDYPLNLLMGFAIVCAVEFSKARAKDATMHTHSLTAISHVW